MLESALTRKIKEALKEKYPRDKWQKIHGGYMQESGISDLIGCHKGRFIAIEVKRTGKDYKSPTPLQEKYLNDVRKAGGISGVATSIDEAFKIVEPE